MGCPPECETSTSTFTVAVPISDAMCILYLLPSDDGLPPMKMLTRLKENSSLIAYAAWLRKLPSPLTSLSQPHFYHHREHPDRPQLHPSVSRYAGGMSLIGPAGRSATCRSYSGGVATRAGGGLRGNIAEGMLAMLRLRPLVSTCDDLRVSLDALGDSYGGNSGSGAGRGKLTLMKRRDDCCCPFSDLRRHCRRR